MPDKRKSRPSEQKDAAAPAPLPARRGLLALLGLGASCCLALLHWQVHNQPGHVSFCAPSEEVDCDTAAMSASSRAAGVPIAAWGILDCGRRGREGCPAARGRDGPEATSRGTPAFMLGDEKVLGYKDRAFWLETVRKRRADGGASHAGPADPGGR